MDAILALEELQITFPNSDSEKEVVMEAFKNISSGGSVWVATKVAITLALALKYKPFVMLSYMEDQLRITPAPQLMNI
ncbi:hypothetical protein PPTG_03480 [Phytophthora nicotianae INRA-310]|uniref:Uncharacterized protein n=1 Tax=Phytophthora nicotianae (strain INRA-310) TaxID=761204 RepID=W2R700_PHYN3|nr:hypothetical protein PPTG_03480 [Phytophthora nicotianae INRA-310]ETN20484.1 hypothetical protein PPTG_03480 [Phytophthora nicotianae INRA-310]